MELLLSITHPELAADGAVVVDHEAVHPCRAELLADGEAGRARADDGDRGLVDLLGGLFRHGPDFGKAFGPGTVDFLHAVHFRDADAADVAVHDHLAGAALADAALHRAVAVLQAVVMDGEACLVQGGGDGLSFLAGDGLSFEDERMQVLLRNAEDGMLRDFVHVDAVSSVFGLSKITNPNEKPQGRCKIIIRTLPAAPRGNGRGGWIRYGTPGTATNLRTGRCVPRPGAG